MAYRIPLTHSIQDKTHQYLLSGRQPLRITYLLLVVLGIALGLRVWGIGFGLPNDFTYDEVHEIIRALKLGAGEYDWQGFGKGGLYYLLFVEYGLFYMIWRITGQIADAHDFAMHYLQYPSAFYLAGRLTVALMGTLTCLMVFWIGRRVYDWRVGLGAAVIGATAYYHGVWSHYINVDIGMTLALWASVLAYIQYEHTARWRWLIGAGGFGGLAIAFKLPGALALPFLFLAMISNRGRLHAPSQFLKEAMLVLLSLLVTLTIVAPEWTTTGARGLSGHFSSIFQTKNTSTDALTDDISNTDDISEAVNAVTIYSGKTWSGYLNLLLRDYNIILTVSALIGMVIGCVQRHRWDLLWSGLIIFFLGLMSIADRPAAERYLLPVVPGLWLLGSRAIVTLSGHRWWIATPAFACVIFFPLVTLVGQNSMYTKPDTRELAKVWIEANVPSGAKILMDGMRSRFVMSPPLNPNETTVARRVAQIGEATRMSRGISQHTLALYKGVTERIQGPTYNLYSTVWGLEVEDLTYYVQSCFDYIVISSGISRRYAQGINQQRFPKSVRFYEQLQTDPRFRMVYSVAPVSWQSSGPTITVYKVIPPCQVSQSGAENADER